MAANAAAGRVLDSRVNSWGYLRIEAQNDTAVV